ncbi:hypothetical protein [Tranquillimonas alkanivorans]|uniref:Bile acid:Na+ symporter, BASS family n=1 Tax=Tranquillimonas alkanivorans TaxID=441119 RepID=A0A1I5UQM7_9RHOB|nr:hypothetical protein [Tranquillimonas alkanivorans]SFP97522.1 hypothetical protein SAMN04488047_12312 [Tranquillimonas alkanivorans]
MRGGLGWLARHGRWVLVAGLAAGIVFPGLARWMAGALVPLIALSLFLAALRVGPRRALPPRRHWPRTVLLVVLGQTVLPLVAAGVLEALGWLDGPLATGAVLVLAAAPITGAPGLALMCRADAGAAMRQLALGTALLPLTALPVFLVLPVFGEVATVLAGAARLLLVIALAIGAAALLRKLAPAVTRPDASVAVDGLVALTMGLVVIGLMSAVGPALQRLDPALPAALALSFGLHRALALATWRAARRAEPSEAAGLAVAASNRNLALFLASLPAAATGDLLLFVGCYQIPMYLTPLTLPRLAGWPRA